MKINSNYPGNLLVIILLIFSLNTFSQIGGFAASATCNVNAICDYPWCNPEFNYNIGFGLGLNIKRNFTVGIEGNFFLIKQQEFIEWVEPGTVVPPTNYAKYYYKAISITGSFYF